jgi:DNA (cytosine-5)-methyltransferase 1
MNGPRIGSLCSGYGGLDMAVEAVLGGSLAWVSDIDKGSCKVLDYRYPDVPNLGDFTVIDWATVEPVEILTAGFPCQPVSGAGKQLGDQDERWLWDDVIRAVRELRPNHVLLENVRGLFTAGSGRLFGRVLGSLADVGFDAEWVLVPASKVGAPHGRPRVFILATDAQRGRRDGWSRAAWGSQVGRAVADRDSQGPLLPTPRASDGDKGLRTLAGAHREFARKGNGADLATVLTLLPTPAVNDMGAGNGNGHGKNLAIELQRVESGWGPYTAAVERWERVTGREAPPPSEAARVREWMMGLPDGWITDVPGISKNEAVKLAGNGVVPQQAAAALRILLNRARVAA